jgi:hypothetical protein
MSLSIKKFAAIVGVAVFGAAALVVTNHASAIPVAGGEPFFLEPFGGGTVNLVTQPGIQVCQTIHASDFDLPNGDFLTLTSSGVPPGATINPPTPFVGAPGQDVIVQFCWTPGPGQVGGFEVVFVVMDSDGLFKKTTLKITVEAPFAVELSDLAGETSAPGGPIRFHWTTASEIDNAYFNVLRSDSLYVEESVAINKAPILALGNPFEGAYYELLDKRVEPGKKYRYWLQAVDIFGEVETFGPITVLAR